MRGCLQVKGGKYYAVIAIGKKRKWINLNLAAVSGNKRKAENKLGELVVQYTQNTAMFDKNSFVSFADSWLKYVKNHVDIITYEGYEQCVNRHIMPYFSKKNLAIQDVRIGDIEEYYNSKAVSGRLDGKEGGLSARTIKLHAVTLSLIFKYAIQNGLIKENPCAYATIPKTAKKSVKNISFYTAEQCQELLEITKGVPLHDIILITFLYGLRRSEVMGLRWCDIDFEQETVTIQHTRVLQKTVVSKDKTKNTSSNRVYPLLNELKEMLNRVMERQDYYRGIFGNAYIESGYIFTNEQGKPFYPSYPTHELGKVLKKVGMPHIRFHDLRHSCASYLLSKGWNMKSISDWLGHSEIHTTMNIYAHINIEQKRELAKTLDNTFTSLGGG